MTEEPPAGIQVRKISAMVPVSVELLMDAGVIPDTREHRPVPRRQRLRWKMQDKVQSWRIRLASKIAGFDVEDTY